jgi:hypothetical protein
VTEEDRPLDYVQLHITDFTQDAELPVQAKEELNRMLKLVVQWHLEEFVRLYLKLMKNPFTLGTFLAHITDSISKMEDKGICYLKRMPDGNIYAFKRAYCWEGVRNWKKCPEFRCSVKFPCCDLPCPNGDDYYENPIDNLDEYQKKELKSFMKKLEEENSGKQS